MKERNSVSPSLRYFFKQLERRSGTLKREEERRQLAVKEVPFEEVEIFFRRIMTQNIFIHTVGLSGRPESTILSKAVFSMDKVVRIYYSTSFDERDSGFVRIKPHNDLQLIIVERVHGYNAKPEILYQAYDECHVIRFIIQWLVRRVDWSKTHLRNLDLYKLYQDQEKQVLEAKIAEQESIKLEEQMASAMKKLKGRVRT
ncbi:hypothetical protein QCB45_10830 [Thiomicrorhabdus sp. ZW0627]|uniref:hypothetical protein n=1 Tax=Thiomicrorhabdus sp. ZW0627 TaxID=3039774 RepID=UPI0024369F26|nr:hypothetical protein [Thiomicrorhabdus sp. ZW0627]MDG6774827.1 hypothetical protein [Thiomicrorhabdus sp. ZW0627]